MAVRLCPSQVLSLQKGVSQVGLDQTPFQCQAFGQGEQPLSTLLNAFRQIAFVHRGRLTFLFQRLLERQQLAAPCDFRLPVTKSRSLFSSESVFKHLLKLGRVRKNPAL